MIRGELVFCIGTTVDVALGNDGICDGVDTIAISTVGVMACVWVDPIQAARSRSSIGNNNIVRFISHSHINIVDQPCWNIKGLKQTNTHTRLLQKYTQGQGRSI